MSCKFGNYCTCFKAFGRNVKTYQHQTILWWRLSLPCRGNNGYMFSNASISEYMCVSCKVLQNYLFSILCNGLILYENLQNRVEYLLFEFLTEPDFISILFLDIYFVLKKLLNIVGIDTYIRDYIFVSLIWCVLR